MFREIFLIFAIVSLTSAKPGHTSAGMHFVIPLPNHIEAGQNTIHVSTQEFRVKITIKQPDSYEFTSYVEKNKMAILSIEESIRQKGVGKFDVTHLESTGPVRVFVNTANVKGTVRSVYKVIPIQSCYDSYYVSVPKGFPVINAVSFDTPLKIKVSIPKGVGFEFNIDCGGDVKCKPGTTVTVSLGAYKVWQMSLDSKDADLQNTHIKSVDQNPFYVLAGSTNCQILTTLSVETCFSSLKPTISWGKTYVVPNNCLVEKMFRFNAKKFPLSLTFYEGAGSPKVVRIDNPHKIHTLKSMKTLVFTGGVVFGMYQLFPSMKGGSVILNDDDASMLNLIPVEQWMHGTIYMYPAILNTVDTVFYLLLSNMTMDDVVFGDVGDRSMTWMRNSTVSVGATRYMSAEVDVTGIQSTRIYSKKPGGRMMTYLRGTDLASGTPESSINFPYDFYQGKIYQSSCVSEYKFSNDDGVDNDCDGHVDEETENGIDDDGDGLVDEDNAEPNEDGLWGQWEGLGCSVKCNNKQASVRSRMCTNQFGFGQPCVGEDLQCNGATCPDPDDCEDTDTCFCDACKSCRTFFECDECKVNYRQTLRCRTPCPRGWGGPACIVPIPLEVRKFEEKSELPWWVIPLCIVLLVVLALIVIIAFCRQRDRGHSSLKVIKDEKEGSKDEGRDEGVSSSSASSEKTEEKHSVETDAA